MEQVSEREPGQGSARSLLHHGYSIHPFFSSVSPLVVPFISLATSVRFRDTAAARVQLFFSNLAGSRTPGNKGRGLNISSLQTITVLNFQLWNLFCATAWNRKVGAVPKFAQW